MNTSLLFWNIWISVPALPKLYSECQAGQYDLAWYFRMIKHIFSLNRILIGGLPHEIAGWIEWSDPGGTAAILHLTCRRYPQTPDNHWEYIYIYLGLLRLALNRKLNSSWFVSRIKISWFLFLYSSPRTDLLERNIGQLTFYSGYGELTFYSVLIVIWPLSAGDNWLILECVEESITF